MKSLRSTGTATRSRIVARSSRLPPKWRGSVRTLMTLAPPASYSQASAAGSVIDAILPLDGLARLTSAITATSWPLSAATASRGEAARLAISLSRSSGIFRWRAARSVRTPSRISLSTLTRFRYPLGSDALLRVMVARPLLCFGTHPPRRSPSGVFAERLPCGIAKAHLTTLMAGRPARHGRVSPRHRGMEQSAGNDEREQRPADIPGEHESGHPIQEEHAFHAQRGHPGGPGAGPDQQREQDQRDDERERDEHRRQVAAAERQAHRGGRAGLRHDQPGHQAHRRRCGTARCAGAEPTAPGPPARFRCAHAHLRAGHAPQAGVALVFGQPFTLTRLTPASGAIQSGLCCPGPPPARSVGSAPRLSASHNAALSAGCGRPDCSGGSYRLDMTGQRGPRQATSKPAATMTSAPAIAAGRHRAAVIVTWPAAVIPGAAPPPGTAPGETPAAPPAVAEPACEAPVARAAASTSAAASGRLTVTAITTPNAAISSPARRRARRRMAMTAARVASAARASAPASGTRSWPLTDTTLAGSGAGAGVATRAHPCRADRSTAPAPATPRARPSRYSRRSRGGGPGAPAGAPWPRSAVTARSAPAPPRRSRSGRRCGRRPRTGPP